MNSVAIITARGGSKRIPRKNIRDFCGKPILAYSIETALRCGCFSEVMVSTEDQEIAETALKYGAKVPFFRSPEMSSDHAMTIPVLQEVVSEYEKRQCHFDYGCCIYPTAPFINPEKIRIAMLLLQESGCDVAVPVVRFSYPIQRALGIKENRVSMVHPEYMNSRSQDLEPMYHDAGQYYCFKISALPRIQTFLSGSVVPIITPESEVQDIDNFEDWKIAEMKYRMMHAEK